MLLSMVAGVGEQHCDSKLDLLLTFISKKFSPSDLQLRHTVLQYRQIILGGANETTDDC